MSESIQYQGSDLDRCDLDHLWHPFTQMKEWEHFPRLCIAEARGNHLIDTQGNAYLDGVSSLWANIHGHGREEINSAIRDQLDRMAHSTLLGLSHPSAVLLAERLCRVAPSGLTRAFYSESGSTAVEIALKIAYQYWKNSGAGPEAKNTFLRLKEGYHGDTLGAVSVGGIDLFHSIYRPMLFPTIAAPSPHCYRCEQGLSPESCGMECAQRVEDILKERHEEIAAMVMEPCVQGAAGILVAPEGYLRRVRESCRKYDVLFIADEVATGFGRTGSLFACQREGVTPDLLTLGKGITGGYLPLAATLATESVFKAFYGDYEELKTFFHGHTYTGNPLSCSAALASLSLFEQDRVIETLPPKIDELSRHLARLADHPHVGQVRQCGLMVGIELVEDKASKAPFPAPVRLGHKVALGCRDHGVIIRNLGDVLVLMPPLSIRAEEITTLFNAVEASLEENLRKIP